MRLTILLPLLLSACLTVPVNQRMPDVPPELAEKCKPLVLIEGETTTLSNLMKTVAANYTLRHECATQLESFQKWYTKQKEEFDKVNK